jgi:signal transduction histidine kinase
MHTENPIQAVEPESLHFEVDAGLLLELGEQLVARKSVALAELIKNAYDADATQVRVNFEDVGTLGGTIIMTDDGQGMSLERLQSNWMRIATDYKVRNPVSPRFGRQRAGAKGVGRFAARKLAHLCTLNTVASVGPSTWERTTITINWDDFRPGLDLSQVAASCTHQFSNEPLETGVTLVLSSVRDVWANQDLTEIWRDLQSLMPPFPDTSEVHAGESSRQVTDPGFSVQIIAHEFPDFEGDLSQQFLSAAVSKLTAIVKNGGQPEYCLQLRGSEKSYDFRPANVRFPDLDGASCLVHYFLYDASSVRPIGMKAKEAREIGRQFGGVKIYLDKFRVVPYGDPGDDWLGLDEDRAGRKTGVDALLRGLISPGTRPMLNLPGNNQLFGGVFISRQFHTNLIPTISRERLLANETFDDLVRFVRLGIDWMTIQRSRIESATSTRSSQQKSSRKEPTAYDLVSQVSTTVKQRLKGGVSSKEARDLIRELDDLTAAVRISTTSQLHKVAMLRILASAGTTVITFVHELRLIIDGLRGIVFDLGEIDAEPRPELQGDLNELRNTLRSWTQMVEAQASQLGMLVGRDARSERRQIAVYPIVEQIESTFELYCEDHGIELVNAVPRYVRTPPLYLGELLSILLNVLTNALKTVKDEPVRRIEVLAQDDGRGVHIYVKDTGQGVDLDSQDGLFEPFEGTSTPDPILGVGTGIGLTIVRDIVEEHGGQVRFIAAHAPWRTRLEITIPHGVDH